MVHSIKGWHLYLQAARTHLPDENDFEWALGVGLQDNLSPHFSFDYGLVGEQIPKLNEDQKTTRWFLGGMGRLRWLPSDTANGLDLALALQMEAGKQDRYLVLKGLGELQVAWTLPLGEIRGLRLFVGMAAGFLVQQRMTDWSLLGGMELLGLFSPPPPISPSQVSLEVQAPPSQEIPPPAKTKEESVDEKISRYQKLAAEAEKKESYRDALDYETRILKLDSTGSHARYFYFHLMLQYADYGQIISKERFEQIQKGPLEELAQAGLYEDIAVGIRLFLERSGEQLQNIPKKAYTNMLIVLQETIDFLYSPEVKAKQNLDRKTFFEKIKDRYFFRDPETQRVKPILGAIDGLRLFIYLNSRNFLGVSLDSDVFQDFGVQVKQ